MTDVEAEKEREQRNVRMRPEQLPDSERDRVGDPRGRGADQQTRDDVGRVVGDQIVPGHRHEEREEKRRRDPFPLPGGSEEQGEDSRHG